VSLLEIEGLQVHHRGRPIVAGVDLTVEPGESLGLAGESGCGKTTTALAIMKLLPPALTPSGSITLKVPGAGDPVKIDRRTERGMQLVRWRHVSLIFQGAMNALDPVQRIEAQIAEAIRLHEPRIARGALRERIAELLRTVGLSATHARAYPHQLSGGQRQRVMIALALACRPALVIADEPTTALDVIMQAQVLDLLAQLRRELGLALILISHDLAVLAETCDRLAVMYAGRIVESGRAADVFASPQHPYTKRLLDSLPAIGGRRGVADPIPGAPPDPRDPPQGCPFRPRCPYATDACLEEPPLREVLPRRLSACHFAPWEAW
jgi:peptide/nickel transport system ATP-binding protein